MNAIAVLFVVVAAVASGGDVAVAIIVAVAIVVVVAIVHDKVLLFQLCHVCCVVMRIVFFAYGT